MTAPDPVDPLVCINARMVGEEGCGEPESAHCDGCRFCPGTCICPRELKPGKYRMAIEVEVDEYGYLYPHDTAGMVTVDWWQQRHATFTESNAYTAILEGRRNQATEIERLQAEVNRLTASPNPASLPSARELVDAWNRRTLDEQLALAAQFLERQEHALRCAMGHCTTKENS